MGRRERGVVRRFMVPNHAARRLSINELSWTLWPLTLNMAAE